LQGSKANKIMALPHNINQQSKDAPNVLVEAAITLTNMMPYKSRVNLLSLVLLRTGLLALSVTRHVLLTLPFTRDFQFSTFQASQTRNSQKYEYKDKSGT